MANLVAIQTQSDGPVNHVQSINIQGDGSGDEYDTPLLDSQLADPVCETFSIHRIAGRLEGFEAVLRFGGLSKPVLWHLPAADAFDFDFSHTGGLKDPRMAGFDGTVLMTTLGLGIGDEGSVIIEAKKKGVTR